MIVGNHKNVVEHSVEVQQCLDCGAFGEQVGIGRPAFAYPIECKKKPTSRPGDKELIDAIRNFHRLKDGLKIATEKRMDSESQTEHLVQVEIDIVGQLAQARALLKDLIGA